MITAEQAAELRRLIEKREAAVVAIEAFVVGGGSEWKKASARYVECSLMLDRFIAALTEQ